MASRRCGMIVGLSRSDHVAYDISRILGITRTTCQSVINNFCEKGSQMLLLVHLFYLIVKSTLLYVKPEKIERILSKKLLNILTKLILPILPDVCYINMIILAALERVSRENRKKRFKWFRHVNPGMKNGIILFGAMNHDFFYLKMMNSN